MSKTKTSTEKEPLFDLIYGGENGDHVIPLTEKQDLVMSLLRKKENEELYMDVRVRVKSDRYTGMTQKGFAIALNKRVEFKETLDEFMAKVDGLYPPPKLRKTKVKKS